VLEVLNIRKSYRSIEVLKGVSFQVSPGELLALIGPNGCGKTTTLQIVSGCLHPTDGDARICGKSIISSPTEAKMSLGYVPQDMAVYPFLTGREFLELVASLRGLDKDGSEEEIESLMEAFSLSDAQNRLTREYSEGMSRKLAICAGFLGHPPVIILDESLNGLDPQSSYIAKEWIQKLLSAGTAMVLTSHILPLVHQLATRVAFLHNGMVAQSLDTGDLQKLSDSGKSLEDAYLDLVGFQKGH